MQFPGTDLEKSEKVWANLSSCEGPSGNAVLVGVGPKSSRGAKKGKEKSQDGWAKLGQRISMEADAGPYSDKEYKKGHECKLKTGSMDRSVAVGRLASRVALSQMRKSLSARSA